MSNMPAVQEEEPILTFEMFGEYTVEATTKKGRAEIAHQLNQEIQTRLTEGNSNYLEAGYFLHVLKSSKCYKAMGDHIRNWGDYLNEAGMSTGTDNMLRGIATVFGKVLEENPELKKADYKRLADLLPIFRTKTDGLDKYREILSSLNSGQTQEQKTEPVLVLDMDADPDAPEDALDAELTQELEETAETHGDERKTAIQLNEEELKLNLLHDAVSLPKKAWESQLQVVRGKEPADDCAHDAEYDVLYRCRRCGQLYSPQDGHCDMFKELEEKTDSELVKEFFDTIEKLDGAQARNHTHCDWHKRRQKFLVCWFQKGDAEIYSTNMVADEYDKKGFINLIIEKKSRLPKN